MARIFQAGTLQKNTTVSLDGAAMHHVARVLRAKVGDPLILFNGEGGEFQGIIEHIDKKTISVKLTEFLDTNNESPLNLYLAQGISRGEKMDFTIQKAVELGVKKIFPLFTERCNVKLTDERSEKRLQHWGSVIVSACEQSGRNLIPEIFSPQALDKFLAGDEPLQKFVLSPVAGQKLSEFNITSNTPVVLLIGPEGGLTEKEIALAEQQGFKRLTLGPRVLRTETAGIAALAALQVYVGDL